MRRSWRVGIEQISRGAQVQSDEEILDYACNQGESVYHPVGTCKMGNGEDAVVDDQLRVRGVTGLRVADASIMPTVLSLDFGLIF